MAHFPRCTKCGRIIRNRVYSEDMRSPELGAHISCPKAPDARGLRTVDRLVRQAERQQSAEPEYEYDAPAPILAGQDDRYAVSDVQAIYDATQNESERQRMLVLLANYAKLDSVMEWARDRLAQTSPEYRLRQQLDAFLVDTLPREARS